MADPSGINVMQIILRGGATGVGERLHACLRAFVFG